MEGDGSSSSNTFAKRKNGLLKRAMELVSYCDAQLGLIVFSCTGQLHEYANPSMEEVIERYNNLKGVVGADHREEPHRNTNMEALQEEIASLKLQVQTLQDCNRQLNGEVSDLSFKDLKCLENQLEMSLSSIRFQKEQVKANRIRDLQLKKTRVRQESRDLKEKVNYIVDQQKNPKSIHERMFFEGNSSEANPFPSSYGYDMNVATGYSHQQQPHPRQDDNERPVLTLSELGIEWPQQNDSRFVEDD